MGFKLNHRAGEQPDRFGALAIHAGPIALSLDLLAVHQGRGVSTRRAWSAVASSMRIEAEGGENLYTVDGDLYRTSGALELSLGPTIRFFKPS